MVDRDVDIVGQGQGVSVVKAQFDTGASGDARGWFLVNAGVELNVSDVTFDGDGQLIWPGVPPQGFGHLRRRRVQGHQVPEQRLALRGHRDRGVRDRPRERGRHQLDVLGHRPRRRAVLRCRRHAAPTTATPTRARAPAITSTTRCEVGAGAVVDITTNTISDNLGVAVATARPRQACSSRPSSGAARARRSAGNIAHQQHRPASSSASTPPTRARSRSARATSSRAATRAWSWWATARSRRPRTWAAPTGRSSGTAAQATTRSAARR